MLNGNLLHAAARSTLDSDSLHRTLAVMAMSKRNANAMVIMNFLYRIVSAHESHTNMRGPATCAPFVPESCVRLPHSRNCFVYRCL